MQVDLGRRAAPSMTTTSFSAQFIHAAAICGQTLALRPRQGMADSSCSPAQQHHLAVRVGLGASKAGSCAHRARRARPETWKVLRAADLAPGARRLPPRLRHRAPPARVVAHVLRLERRHLQPLVAVVAALGPWPASSLPAPLLVPTP